MDAAGEYGERNSRIRAASHLRDFVTVLTTKGPLATKRIVLAPGDTKPTIEPYGNAKFFSISEHAVGGIDDLARLLTEFEHRETTFVVRGRPAEGIDRHHALRRSHRRTKSDGTVEPATLEPASHHWIAIDLDSIDCPDWLDPVREPARAVEYVVDRLPGQFNGVTCRWSFTSGQGIKPGIRMRLFFWADRALADGELKAWLGDRIPMPGVPRTKWPLKYPVDESLYAAAQPIFVAGPVFIGMPDPIPIRSGVWRGDRDMVTPPPIEKAKLSTPQQTAKAYGKPSSTYELHRSRIGDHEDGDGFFAPSKRAAASFIARQGASADTGWLRADLEQAIRRAPRDPAKHPDEYIETRIRDLDPLIAAIVGLQAASEEAKRGAGECEPTHHPPLGSIEEAREQLARISDEHVASITAYAEAVAGYEVALKEWRARQAA